MLDEEHLCHRGSAPLTPSGSAGCISLRHCSLVEGQAGVAFCPPTHYAGGVIDFTKEKPLSLAAVSQRFGVTVKTVRSWARGVGGRRLETAKLGGKRFTSLEAIQRFSRQTAQQKQLPFNSRSTRKRRNSENAQRLIALHE